jgi:hypothetical protein
MAMKTAGGKIARWLQLAAAPTFAITAVLTGILGGSVSGGMVPMYMLMAVFNVAPWLELISRQGRKRGPDD